MAKKTSKKKTLNEAQMRELAASINLRLKCDATLAAAFSCMLLEGMNQHELVQIIAGKWYQWTGKVPPGTALIGTKPPKTFQETMQEVVIRTRDKCAGAVCNHCSDVEVARATKAANGQWVHKFKGGSIASCDAWKIWEFV